MDLVAAIFRSIQDQRDTFRFSGSSKMPIKICQLANFWFLQVLAVFGISSIVDNQIFLHTGVSWLETNN